MGQAKAFWDSLSETEKTESINLDSWKAVGTYRGWEPKGQILEKWINLLPIIQQIVNNPKNNDWIFYKSSKPRVQLCELYMVGRSLSAQNVRPTIVSICREKKYAKRLVYVLQKSQYISRLDLGFDFLACEGDRDDIRRVGASDETEPTPIDEKSLCGAPVIVEFTTRQGKSIKNAATLGGVVTINNKHYGMMAAHALFDPETNPPTDSENSTSTTIDLDDEHLSNDDFVPDEGALAENTSAAALDYEAFAVYTATSEDIKVSRHNPFHNIWPRQLISANQPDSKHIQPDGGWGLIALKDRLPIKNQIQTPETILSCKKASSTPPQSDVLVAAGFSGIDTTTCIGTPLGLFLPGPHSRHQMLITWRLSGQSSPGDSGSWVVDKSSGDLHAMVIASSSSSDETYCIPMTTILDSIITIEGSETVVSIGGGSQYVPSNPYVGQANGTSLVSGKEPSSRLANFTNNTSQQRFEDQKDMTGIGSKLVQGENKAPENTEKTLKKKFDPNDLDEESRKVYEEARESYKPFEKSISVFMDFLDGQTDDPMVKVKYWAGFSKALDAFIDSKKSETKTVAEGDFVEQPPTFIRIDKKHISTKTLDDHDLPWEFDESDSDFIVIKQHVAEDLQKELFEHTETSRRAEEIKVSRPNIERIDLDDILGDGHSDYNRRYRSRSRRRRPRRRTSISSSSSHSHASSRQRADLQDLLLTEDTLLDDALDLNLADLIEGYYDQAFMLFTTSVVGGVFSDKKQLETIMGRFQKLRARKREAVKAISRVPYKNVPLRNLASSIHQTTEKETVGPPYDGIGTSSSKQPSTQPKSKTNTVVEDTQISTPDDTTTVKVTRVKADEIDGGPDTTKETLTAPRKEEVIEVIEESDAGPVATHILRPQTSDMAKRKSSTPRIHRDESRIDPVTGGINRLVREGRYTISDAALKHYGLSSEYDSRNPRDLLVKPWVTDRMVGDLMEWTTAHKDAKIREDIYGSYRRAERIRDRKSLRYQRDRDDDDDDDRRRRPTSFTDYNVRDRAARATISGAY